MSQPETHMKESTTGDWILRVALAVVWALCLTALLAGCGGGGDDEEDEHVDTPSSQCAASSAACK